jgi:DNA-binding beta-propeller fold protein YncE
MTKFADDLFADLMREHGPALQRLDQQVAPPTAGSWGARARPAPVPAGDPRPPRRRSPWLAPAAAAVGVTLAVSLAAVLGSRVHHGASPRQAGDGRTETAYVFNGFEGTMTPISPVTGRLGKPVVIGPGARRVKVGKRYVKTPSIVQDALLPDGTTNYAVAVHGSGHEATATVWRTSLVTGAAARPIQLGSGFAGMVVMPGSKTAYVTYVSYGSNGIPTANVVRPVSLATGAAGAPILRGPGPRPLAITPDGRTVYAVSPLSGTVTPISTATNRPGKPLPVHAANQVVLTPNGRIAFAIGESELGHQPAHETVTPISTATNTAGRTIIVGPWLNELTFAPDGKTVYIGSSTSVTPVSIRTGRRGKPIRLKRAGDMAIASDSKTGYVVNVVYSRVTPISLATNTVGPPISVTGFPLHIVMSPDGRTAYASGNYSRHEQVVTPISTARNIAGKPIMIRAPGVSIMVPGEQDGGA